MGDSGPRQPGTVEALARTEVDGRARPELVSSEPTFSGQEARSIGPYLVLRRIGVGGMGTVYSAFDERLDRRVAIKVLHPAGNGTEGRQRLVREAQALARLGHPNVVYVYEVGEFEGRLFLAMEFIEGTTLTRWQAEGVEHRWRDTLHMYLQAGRGLLAAHEAGLIHRDFKPDNVLVGKDGRPRVVDFGLARSPAAGAQSVISWSDGAPSPLASPLTAAGTVMGTPMYMSPEQFCGELVDSRSDQFSFCTALYEALYGMHPFASDTFEGLRERVLSGKVPPPPKDSQVPTQIHQVLSRGLSRDQMLRFPSMRELLAALDINPAHDSAMDRRSRWLLASASSVSVLSFLGVFYYLLLTTGVSYRFLEGSFATIFVGGAVSGLIARRTLKQFAFHRGIYVSLMLGMGANVGYALVGTRMQIPISYLGIAGMISVGGMYGILAYHYLPRLWLYSGLATAVGMALGLTAAPEMTVLKASQIVYPLTAIGLAWEWVRSSHRKARREDG